jgi:Uncharacterized alpha/beta hydrolase domain (DUF2235)
MSYISYIGGKYIETTGGDSLIYARENIVTNSQGPIEITSGEGIFFGEPEIYESNETLKGVKVFASIFFDGTKNNRNNTFRRIDKDAKSNTSDDSKTIYKNTKQSESSYENGYSNIAALSYMTIAEKSKREVSIYIEGEGTEDNKKGDTDGYAFGAGATGIPAKVNKGFIEINKKVNDLFDNTLEYVRDLTIDVFGFSRGAAAARHFIMSTKAQLKANYPKAKIVYRFVGLFDSVSSYEPAGVWGALNYNFDNDLTELGLQLDDVAQKVVHLTAGDEYRKNFALTTIASAIAAGVGYELQLPGAHSDIGGGYEEYEHIETRHIDENVRTVEDWIAEGWYTEDQIPYEDRRSVNCKGTRKLKNSYQFVSLAIMMEFSKKHLTFEGFDINEQNKNFKVIPDLENIKNSLLDFALSNDGAVSKVASLPTKAEMKKLRNKYLHVSSNAYSTGMGPNVPGFWSNERKRHIIQDNEK